MRTRPAAIAAHLVAACLAAAPVGASWFGGCTTTIVGFKLEESPPPGGSEGGQDALEIDAFADASPADASPADASLADASPADASLDAGLDASPDDGSTEVTTGRSLYVQYKCCLTTADCAVKLLGDGLACRDLGEWKLLAGKDCESQGGTLYSLSYEKAC